MNVILDEEEVKYLIRILLNEKEYAGSDGDRERWDRACDLLDKLGWKEPPAPIALGLQYGQWEVIRNALKQHRAKVQKTEDQGALDQIGEILSSVEEALSEKAS